MVFGRRSKYQARRTNIFETNTMPLLSDIGSDLAAAFRLAAHYEFNEGICNHFSAALSKGPERYLINPYGVHWSEMRPESLLLIDGSGSVIEDDGEVEATARNIHIAGHRANPKHLCILHTHMPFRRLPCQGYNS